MDLIFYKLSSAKLECWSYLKGFDGLPASEIVSKFKEKFGLKTELKINTEYEYSKTFEFGPSDDQFLFKVFRYTVEDQDGIVELERQIGKEVFITEYINFYLTEEKPN
jgi:hypothetical protein